MCLQKHYNICSIKISTLISIDLLSLVTKELICTKISAYARQAGVRYVLLWQQAKEMFGLAELLKK